MNKNVVVVVKDDDDEVMEEEEEDGQDEDVALVVPKIGSTLWEKARHLSASKISLSQNNVVVNMLLQQKSLDGQCPF